MNLRREFIKIESFVLLDFFRTMMTAFLRFLVCSTPSKMLRTIIIPAAIYLNIIQRIDKNTMKYPQFNQIFQKPISITSSPARLRPRFRENCRPYVRENARNSAITRLTNEVLTSFDATISKQTFANGCSSSLS